MLVIDHERSEHGPQRRKSGNGRLLHCCCVCGRLDTWGDSWSSSYSYKDLEDSIPIPKFCSATCRDKGGADAQDITDEMKKIAKDAEWREPETAYREATSIEKYRDAAHHQKKKRERSNSFTRPKGAGTR